MNPMLEYLAPYVCEDDIGMPLAQFRRLVATRIIDDLESVPEYSVVDIMEYLRLLHRKAYGLDGPIPAQWRGVERYLEPFISE